jgi:RNA polymerase sigma-70 factor (ECF subfamily)
MSTKAAHHARGIAGVRSKLGDTAKAMSETPSTPTNLTAEKPQAQRPGLTDERLMLAFTQGSSEAFSELFDRYRQPVYGFFCRRVSDPASAEELAQETFFALLRASTRYEPRALFRTYLYAISFKILRAHRRKAAFRAAFLGHRHSRPDPSTEDATEAGLWVRRAVEKLDALDREIVMLREFEQLSYAEIADLLRLPLNTVRSRLFRARTALRELLEPSASAPKDARAYPDAPTASPAVAQINVEKGRA